ncbi:MAG TPA: IS1634 family transposase [Glutamicibacter sp.]|uniref:IS1634 family transposase n=1 Tax=Glutamicibacter arilaitensis TaxID=256701 RepID=UPI000EEEA7F9|nr:IS1634 family transposase [Glutamicibacter sp.]
MEHIGSANTDAELALLLRSAEQRLHPGQQAFDFGDVEQEPVSLDQVADWAKSAELSNVHPDRGRPRTGTTGAAKVVASPATELWDILTAAYARLGFEVLDDEGFRAMVLARLIEPTSKADTIRVLDDICAPHPSLRTLFRSQHRCHNEDYKDTLAKAMIAYRTQTVGLGAMIMYDVTTLHFESKKEDDLRKVGMSKEHRVDPQIQVGLLVDPAGFPLEMHMFAGNKAETTTIVPVVQAFQERHGITDMVVVADAGMLSAANLTALEDAGFKFIVGSRMAKAPYDLQEHFDTKGNRFANGQILDSTRVMGVGAKGRERRVIYQWAAKRFVTDNRNINLMERLAMDIAEGTSQMRKARFVKTTGTKPEVDEARIELARMLAGLKGYVTNIEQSVMKGQQVLDSYHDLWQVEASFRMTKSDLSARPVFHRDEDASDAHLTVVFAALAIGRHLQEISGMSLKRIITDLKGVRSAKIQVNGDYVVIPAEISAELRELLKKLQRG